jgi:Mce-associated membrane protein
VLALSTGKFRKDYESNFSGLSALFTTTKGQSTATVKDVFVSGTDHDTASAIVVLDERGQGTAGQRLNVDWYLRLSLVKVGGNWRVDDLTNLNFAGQGPTAVPGATTPTSAPAK